jgi:hypothetical protein
MVKKIKKNIKKYNTKIIKERTNDKVIRTLLYFINNNEKLKKIFNHCNRKHKLEHLLDCSLNMLQLGLSYRETAKKYEEKNKIKIHFSTIAKFHNKLQKYKIIEESYNKNVTNYLNELNKHRIILHTDTTFICNKLGSEDVSYNQQIKKHKTSKISIITDDFNVSISVITSTGKTNDALILKTQLDDLYNKQPSIFDNTKILLADAAYNSSILDIKIKDLELGILITPS